MTFDFNNFKIRARTYFRQALAYYRQNRRRTIAIALLVLVVLLWVLPPAAYPKGRVIRITKGMAVAEVASYLEEKKVVQSELLFTLLVKLVPGEAQVIAGDYMLNRRNTVFGIVYRLMTGGFEIEPVRVRVPEGATVKEVAIILGNRLPEFNRQEFLQAASTSEGYLFPDTYFFLPTASTTSLVEEMRENFERQIDPLRLTIFKSQKSLEEIVTMASILEKEAHLFEDKEVIAGILWKRLEAGMRLQVDAVFPYILGKNTFQLTKTDLRYDSPYNTYRYAGLPPGPIGNPGLESIKAAASPVDSPYWFYLSDLKSQMHYAVNYDDHLKNKNKYLR